MRVLANRNWWEAAGTRMIKTISQCLIASVGTAAVISQVDWKTAISSSVLAGVISLAMSLSGLPEVDEANDTDGDIG